MHNALCQHLQLEQFTDELDETETLALGLLRGIVLVQVEYGLYSLAGLLRLLVRYLLRLVVGRLGRSSSSRCLLRDPTTLKVLLAAVQQVLAEQLAACNGLALVVLDAVVLHLGADLLHHLAAQTSVDPGVHQVICCTFKSESDNLDERAAVLLILALVRPCDDLVRDRVEFLQRQPIEQTHHLAVHHLKPVHLNKDYAPAVFRRLLLDALRTQNLVVVGVMITLILAATECLLVVFGLLAILQAPGAVTRNAETAVLVELRL